MDLTIWPDRLKAVGNFSTWTAAKLPRSSKEEL
jgi:hypothetical protein